MKPEQLVVLSRRFMLDTLKVGIGDVVWIEYCGDKAEEIALACETRSFIAGATTLAVDASHQVINNMEDWDQEDFDNWSNNHLTRMMHCTVYIRIIDDADQALITLSQEQRDRWAKAKSPVTRHRVDNCRWLVVAATTEEFATQCGMSLDNFEEFYIKAISVGRNEYAPLVQPLVDLMASGKKVRIVSPNQHTDLTFSIEGIPAVPCIGERNLPDGECYTAPVKDSVNGTVTFGPSVYQGIRFEWIDLSFQNGKVINVVGDTPDNTHELKRILDSDDGARFVGEFALGFNPYISKSTGSILFDEKIAGSFHFALGNSYKDASNGNSSVIHWDMIQVHDTHNKGEIWIDDVLIRKNGIFMPPILQPLNPENLLWLIHGIQEGKASP